MENNYYNQQPQYQQPQYYQTVDPNYSVTVKDFLTKAIVSCAICALPVGSIIAIFMASKNREAVLDYIAKGGPHTTRVKVCSALSRAGKYGGIGYTIFWGFYLLYFAFVFGALIITAIAQTH